MKLTITTFDYSIIDDYKIHYDNDWLLWGKVLMLSRLLTPKVKKGFDKNKKPPEITGWFTKNSFWVPGLFAAKFISYRNTKRGVLEFAVIVCIIGGVYKSEIRVQPEIKPHGHFIANIDPHSCIKTFLFQQ